MAAHSSTSSAAKQFLALDGVPILVHSLRAFASVPRVTAIYVAVRKNEMARVQAQIAEYLPHMAVGGHVASGDTIGERAAADQAPQTQETQTQPAQTQETQPRQLRPRRPRSAWPRSERFRFTWFRAATRARTRYRTPLARLPATTKTSSSSMTRFAR